MISLQIIYKRSNGMKIEWFEKEKSIMIIIAVQGIRFRVQGSRFKVQGSRFKVSMLFYQPKP